MSTNIAYQASSKGLSIVVSGRTTFLEKEHVNYEKAKALIVANDMDGLSKLVTAQASVLNEKALAEFEGVEVFRNTAYANGIELSGRLLERMIETATEGLPIAPLVNLLKNIRLNPSYRCVQGFFMWLDKNHLAYTDDGHFLAYKIVTANFLDCRTETFDNSPGKTVKVERNEVDDDPDTTCSNGLHGCGVEYLPHYGSWVGSHRIVCIKVNPANLVAFPTDYEHSKFRCSEYVVVEEIAKDVIQTYFKTDEANGDDSDDETDEDETDDDDLDEELNIIEYRPDIVSDWEPYEHHGFTTREECEEWVSDQNDATGEELYRIKPDDGSDDDEDELDWPYHVAPEGLAFPDDEEETPVAPDTPTPEQPPVAPTDEPPVAPSEAPEAPVAPEAPAEAPPPVPPAPEQPQEQPAPPEQSPVAPVLPTPEQPQDQPSVEPIPLVPTGPVMSEADNAPAETQITGQSDPSAPTYEELRAKFLIPSKEQEDDTPDDDTLANLLAEEEKRFQDASEALKLAMSVTGEPQPAPPLTTAPDGEVTAIPAWITNNTKPTVTPVEPQPDPQPASEQTAVVAPVQTATDAAPAEAVNPFTNKPMSVYAPPSFTGFGRDRIPPNQRR